MNMGFEVRCATYDDIEAIAKITGEAFRKYAEMINMESVAALCETYDDIKKDIDENIVLVAFSDGVPVGSVDIKMKDMGIKKIYLHTGSKVASLVKFYYGRGFYIDSTTKDKGYVRALLVKEY